MNYLDAFLDDLKQNPPSDKIDKICKTPPATRPAGSSAEFADFEVRGKTRAANLAKIQAQYEVQIVNERRHGNIELADALEKQRQSALLAEQIREYELGAGGRAKERQEELRRAQVARIVESQQRNKSIDDKQPNQNGESGLRSGNLRSSGLEADLSKHKNLVGSLLDKRKPSEIDAQKRNNYEQKITELLIQIHGDLSK